MAYHNTNLFEEKVALVINSKDHTTFNNNDYNISFVDLLEVLQNNHLDVKVIDLANNDLNLIDNSIWKNFSRVFLAITSNNKISFGYIQGMLDFLNLPYTGCGMLAAALSGDRVKSKKIWQSYGVATTPFVKFKSAAFLAELQEIISLFGFPLAVKSVYTKDRRIFKASSMDQLSLSCTKFDNFYDIIIEPWVTGQEYVVYIIKDQALTPLLACNNQLINDLPEKNNINANSFLEYNHPPQLNQHDINNMQKLAFSAYLALGCVGFAEIRVIRDINNDCWVSSINVTPDLASNANFAVAAGKSGITFDALIEKIFATSFMKNKVELLINNS